MKKSISISELAMETTDGKMAEMSVSGVIRGGYINNDKFYYCESVRNGCFVCEINSTIKRLF